MHILNQFVCKLYTRHLLIFKKGLSSEDMFTCTDIVELKGQSECVAEKNVSDGKEMSKNINDRSETEIALVDDPLNMQGTASNETTLVSEIPNIINEEKILFAPWQEKKQFQI